MRAIPFYAAFESTYQPLFDQDVAETGRHDTTWSADLDRVLSAGVRHFRYPMRWHRVEPERGVFDWEETDRVMAHFERHNAFVVVDFVHHTSYPAWLEDGFADPNFPSAFLEFVRAICQRYPKLRAYTLFNEPFATLMLSGHDALWPPYEQGIKGFTTLALNVLPAIAAAERICRDALPNAQHVWVDTAERHAGTSGCPADYAALANDRRFALLDLVLKKNIDDESIESRPFLQELIKCGGESLLDLPAIGVDLLGLDYYSHSEWYYDEVRGHAPSPYPVGFAEIAHDYYLRYQIPCFLSETNLRGFPSDRACWLKLMLQEYHRAVDLGVDLRGFCWFPYVDSCDWDSLLAQTAGHIDPVGVVSMDARHRRVRTTFTKVWERASAGVDPEQLPAYQLQEPCRTELAGYLPFMSAWKWINTPHHDLIPAREYLDEENEMTKRDLVVFSHLRWDSVWQRPHHLVSRFAQARADQGLRTWFVEEPEHGSAQGPRLISEDFGNVTVLRLQIPPLPTHPRALGFDAEGAENYDQLLLDAGVGGGNPDVLVYTPMALELAQSMQPGRMFYDVMDDLASFLLAPPGLVMHQQRLLQVADVVFTGGRSLHASITSKRSHDVHLFPSGVESEHYRSSRDLREERDERVAGYVGVIDERLDLALIAELAAALPDWTIRMVGPLSKIYESDLPQAANIEYTGQVAYQELPVVMAKLDVALMPFALNEATRSISPTKTLEYLAAGLPVVSTRVPDVVADYEGLVHLADSGIEFAKACQEVIEHSRRERDAQVAPIAAKQEWDYIASEMEALMDAAVLDLRLPGRVSKGATA